METAEFQTRLQELSATIDDLEDALAPLLKQDLADTAAKLPLLDKAKLNVLSTYAIESLVFSILKLSGADARSHPVFTELARVKQYFAKIEAAETQPQQATAPNVSLDKAAAHRVIRHALAGNERGERMNTKIVFREDSDAKTMPQQRQGGHAAASDGSGQRKATAAASPSSPSGSSDSSDSSDSSSSSSSDSEAPKAQKARRPPTKEEQEASTTTQRQPVRSSMRKRKSTQPPKDGATVFRELLDRPKKRVRKDGK